jgi:hypothetical protein
MVQACEEGRLRPGTILGIAVPLLQQAIVEGVPVCSMFKLGTFSHTSPHGPASLVTNSNSPLPTPVQILAPNVVALAGSA